MRLKNFGKLLSLWKYAIEQGSNVVLMRHAPKAGSDDSGLSEEGRRLAIWYGSIVRFAPLREMTLACTNKDRTVKTLKHMFPFSDEAIYLRPECLEANNILSFVQDQVNEFHKEIGRFKGYLPNHSYYFLQKMDISYNQDDLHNVIAGRMARGIGELFEIANSTNIVIYCGHSPAIEVGLEELLGLSLSELGGFLNPLDSVHLRMREGKIECVARINPIVDYVDLENESYF